MNRAEKISFAIVVLIVLLIFFLTLPGCRCKKDSFSSSNTTEKLLIRERLIFIHDTISLPGVEASGEALFECDSLNRVALKQLNISESEKLRLKAMFDQLTGKFNFNSYRPPDTVFVEVPVLVSDTTQTNNTEVKEKEIVYVNKLTWYQKTLMWAGLISIFLFMGSIIKK